MLSDRKVAANRQNSQRSTGPRTALAKKRIRRNALRHGLAATTVNGPGIPAETDHLAQAICGSDTGPAQREQAQIIAECELLLLRVRAARVKIFEEISLRAPGSDEPSVLSHQQDATSCLERLMRLECYDAGGAIGAAFAQTRMCRFPASGSSWESLCGTRSVARGRS
jgi:hypothetical protein